MNIGASSLFGFQSGAEDTDNNCNYGEALREDSAPHQQLGLPGLPLVEGAEAVHQRSGGPQATYRDERVLLGFPHEFFLEGFIFDPWQRAESFDDRRLREVERNRSGRRCLGGLVRDRC